MESVASKRETGSSSRSGVRSKRDERLCPDDDCDNPTAADYARSRARSPDEKCMDPVPSAVKRDLEPLASRNFHIVVMVRTLGPWMLHRVRELVLAGLDAHIIVDEPLDAMPTRAEFRLSKRLVAVPPIMQTTKEAAWCEDGMSPAERDFCAERVHFIGNHVIKSAGFTDLQTKTCNKSMTAWERGLYWCALQHTWDYVLTIEDDAQWTDPTAIIQLCKTYEGNDADLLCHRIAESPAAHPSWPHWHCGEGMFEPKHFTASFNVVMRMSRRLLQAVKDFGQRKGTLLFHELMFASLAKEHGLKIHYWNDEPLLMLRWRPEFSDDALEKEYLGTTRCIFHPIKRETKIWYEHPWAKERAIAISRNIVDKPRAVVTSAVQAYDDI
jgi:hypothetical protein